MKGCLQCSHVDADIGANLGGSVLGDGSATVLGGSSVFSGLGLK